MQTLRDTATLVILILLALTLRVDFGGRPVELDLATPAEASVDEVPVTPQAPAEPEVQPAAMCSVSEPLAPPVFSPGIEQSLDAERNNEDRVLVIERGGKRFVVALAAEGPRFEIRTTTKTETRADDPGSCKGPIRAHLAS